MKREKKSNVLKNIALVSQIGISMIVPILGGVMLGGFLDEKLGTGVIFLVVFCIIGIMTAFVNLYKVTTKDVSKRK